VVYRPEHPRRALEHPQKSLTTKEPYNMHKSKLQNIHKRALVDYALEALEYQQKSPTTKEPYNKRALQQKIPTISTTASSRSS